MLAFIPTETPKVPGLPGLHCVKRETAPEPLETEGEERDVLFGRDSQGCGDSVGREGAALPTWQVPPHPSCFEGKLPKAWGCLK